MTYAPITPFRRTVDAGLLQRHAEAQQALPSDDVNKWEALRELAAARQTYGLSDRDIAVLQALLSFFPDTILRDGGDLIVYPSNKAICERLNGMADSTMRRHLASLVTADIVIRRDSPNGKRYVRRCGDEKIVYGFDLSPLVRRHREFCKAAETLRQAAERFDRLRETVSLMRRDLFGLSEYGERVRPELGMWARFRTLAASTAQALRRKLAIEDLKRLEEDLHASLCLARDALEMGDAGEMSSNDVRNEQHIQISNTDTQESENSEKQENKSGDVDPLTHDEAQVKMPTIPIALVLDGCPEFQAYSEDPVRHWHEIVGLANFIRPMMGISPSAWAEATAAMGPEEASVVLVAMLERSGDIRSPGGYLRALTAKAREGKFSCGPMIMALLTRDAA